MQDFNNDKYKESFFIRRPVLSTVISLIITIIGLLAMLSLPIEQYPNLVPSVITVNAVYPGASPETMAATVAGPLEQQINGVEGMIYMSSISSASGSIAINVSFGLEVDSDMALVNVNNRVQAALNSLPEDVRRYGVTVKKGSNSILQFVALYSPEGLYDSIYITNYALVNVLDNLKRIKGVGSAEIMGAQDYSMRIWLKPDRLQFFGLTPTDVAGAISQQNAQYSAGMIGSAPSPSSIEMTWQVNTRGRLVTPEEFRNIILRTNPDGGVLRLGDVADVELGAYTYDMFSTLNDYEMTAISINLAPGANALATAELVKAEMERLAQFFPHGIEYQVPYDTTLFVKASVMSVVTTLLEAVLLVFFVVYLFLQNWRATLIPCIAVPISIIGTFAGMLLLGFTINTLTLFGMVLAIGIVVDDAIVVLENVERILATEKGITSRQATAKAMNEVTGALIAIVLVLSSVFIPVAFLGGIAGEMYKQFAITIAISVALSGVVAITLTPSLCVIFLKPHHHEPARFFRWFNHMFDRVTYRFTNGVKRLIKSSAMTLGIFGAVCFSTLWLFENVPTELVPNEDQGFILALIQLPEGTALGPTKEVGEKISKKIRQMPGVGDVVSLAGYDLISGALGSNAATMFITLESWSDRAKMGFNLRQFIGAVYMLGMQEPNALVLPFNPPPIMGMSTTGGFEMYIQSQSGDVKELADVSREFIAKANQLPELNNVSTLFSINSPRIFIDLDRENANALKVNISDVFSTLSSMLGTAYINDFNYIGRTYKVVMQAQASDRAHPEDIDNLYVRSTDGNMIPLASLVTLTIDGGPRTVERFNGITAAKVTGSPATGYSSGQALVAIENLAKAELPLGYSYGWSGTSYQEVETGGTNFGVFGLAILMVLLILAAQYERWSLPLAVISAIPFAIFGAILINWTIGLSNGVYTQVAIITLLGLASKNAILIVEFAAELHRDGMSPREAAIESAKLRFRPIIMTSLAFSLGCVPLVISGGAGAASRFSIGATIICGMAAATVLAPLFVPYFFDRIMTLSNKFSEKFSDK